MYFLLQPSIDAKAEATQDLNRLVIREKKNIENKIKTKMPKPIQLTWVIPKDSARNVYMYHDTWKTSIG